MPPRPIIDVDDENMIKDFLARLDLRTSSKQNSQTASSPDEAHQSTGAPTEKISNTFLALNSVGEASKSAGGVRLSANGVFKATSGKNGQSQLDAHRTASETNLAPSINHVPAVTVRRAIPLESGTSNSRSTQWVHPVLRYESEELRAYVPLLTHSGSGSLAQQRIQAIIADSRAEQPVLQDFTAPIPYRNRVPLPQISQIAAKFQQWCPVFSNSQVRKGKFITGRTLTSLLLGG